ncbi:MAG: DUF2779 domain-containing protein [Chthonomonas sp.]|nr:DUF2779 domain-containing protein [Chthonomonas sp.]
MSVTKRAYKLAQRCPRLAWYSERHRSPLDETIRWRIDVGNRIGEYARRRYPTGVLLPWRDGLEATKEAIADTSNSVLFEPSFQVGSLVTRADVLERVPGGWRLIEFKSGASVKPDYEQEAFFQAYVMGLCGIPIEDVCIGFVNTAYRWPGDVDYDHNELLQVESVWARKDKVMPKVDAGIRIAEAALASEEAPAKHLARKCFRPDDCEFLEKCHPEGTSGTIFHIPDLNWRAADKLVESGIVFSADLTDQSELNESTIRTLAAIRTGKPDYDPGLQVALDQVKFPALFLDFETVGSAFPLFAGTRPYEDIQFQWSGHMVDYAAQPESEWRHFEFLPEGAEDPREDFCQTILPLLREAATVVHYSPYEERQLGALNRAEIPGSQECLDLLKAKQWDLMVAIKDNVFHPDFKGKTSIKVTLPTLVEGFSYDGLNIKDGQAAQIGYLRMIDSQTPPEIAAQTREDLLAYCKLDTEAMVRIYQALCLAILPS